jgi:hypothetical protein
VESKWRERENGGEGRVESVGEDGFASGNDDEEFTALALDEGR